MTTVVHSAQELRHALVDSQRPRALVPTMGALHAGHAELISRARDQVGAAGQVVVSVFVNPLQFTDAADLEKYPVTSESDLELMYRSGVDVAWLPAVSDIYPAAIPAQQFEPGPLGQILEGASRPGHFAGMLTVVHRLLSWVEPDFAVFGEKDYQQLVLVRELVAHSGLPVELLAVPIVRDADGLALSSRNSRLNAAARSVALAIPRAIAAGVAAAGSASDVEAAASAELRGLDVDYVRCLSSDLAPPPASGIGRLLVAAVVGGVRLIDNASVLLTEKS